MPTTKESAETMRRMRYAISLRRNRTRFTCGSWWGCSLAGRRSLFLVAFALETIYASFQRCRFCQPVFLQPGSGHEIDFADGLHRTRIPMHFLPLNPSRVFKAHGGRIQLLCRDHLKVSVLKLFFRQI